MVLMQWYCSDVTYVKLSVIRITTYNDKHFSQFLAALIIYHYSFLES